MRFFVCVAVTMVVACNALVGNDPPKARTAVVSDDRDASAEAGATGVVCASSEKLCFGACVPKFSSGFSCASETSCDPCPQAAHATPVCNGAVCGAECKKGYDNCETSAPDCETDLSNPSTCGGCNVRCEKFCSPNAAGSFGCTDACDAGLETCGQKCVDLQNSVANCGACDKACPEPKHATASCKAAQCGFACDSGFHACGEGCAGDTDINACGPNCIVCGPPPPNTTMACNRNACEATCIAGWGDCDGIKENGCETDLMNDVRNCGACTIYCDGNITTASVDVEPRIIRPIPQGCCIQGACSVNCLAY